MSGVDVLSEEYGLDGAELAPTELGAINDNYFVSHQTGEYVLKRYRPEYNGAEHIRRVCEVQALMQRSGVPVPRLIANRRGQVVTEAADACYVLSVKARGRHYGRGQLPAHAAASMGRVLGHIHLVMAGIAPTKPYEPPAPEAALAEYRLLLAKAEQATGEVDLIARRVLQYRIGAVQRLSPLCSPLKFLPVQWVHGDCQLTNVLFDADGTVTAVLDFDNLRCRPRVLELVRTMDLCFERRPDGLSDEALAFFRAYAEAVRLPRAEAALIGAQGAYWSVTGTWPIGSRYLEPEAYQARWDRYIVPPSDWWERNYKVLSEQLLAELDALPAGTTHG